MNPETDATPTGNGHKLWAGLEDYMDSPEFKKALADEFQAEYLDLQQVWGDYIRATGKPLEFFKRDPMHANARGEAVLASILEQYFLPHADTRPPHKISPLAP